MSGWMRWDVRSAEAGRRPMQSGVWMGRRGCRDACCCWLSEVWKLCEAIEVLLTQLRG